MEKRAGRKPHVDPLVPTAFVDWLLDHTHVATPDTEIVAELEKRFAANANDSRWTAKLRRQTVRYALWKHHRNFAEYAWVMGSH